MFHQRNILKFYYFLAAIGAFILTGFVGSLIISIIIMAIVSLPVILVIVKIFPAPDWYEYEKEGSEMTELNLSTPERLKEK